MNKIETYKEFGIYEKSDKELKREFEAGMIPSKYGVYLPGESPTALDAAEWEADGIQECRDFVDSY